MVDKLFDYTCGPNLKELFLKGVISKKWPAFEGSSKTTGGSIPLSAHYTLCRSCVFLENVIKNNNIKKSLFMLFNFLQAKNEVLVIDY